MKLGEAAKTDESLGSTVMTRWTKNRGYLPFKEGTSIEGKGGAFSKIRNLRPEGF